MVRGCRLAVTSRVAEPHRAPSSAVLSQEAGPPTYRSSDTIFLPTQPGRLLLPLLYFESAFLRLTLDNCCKPPSSLPGRRWCAPWPTRCHSAPTQSRPGHHSQWRCREAQREEAVGHYLHEEAGSTTSTSWWMSKSISSNPAELCKCVCSR